MAFLSTKAAISLKRVKIEEKLLWMTDRNLPTLFRTVPSPTHYGLLFPKIGGSQPHPNLQSLLSREWVKLRTSNLVGTLTGSIRTKTHQRFWRKGSVGVSMDYSVFKYPQLSQEFGVFWTFSSSSILMPFTLCYVVIFEQIKMDGWMEWVKVRTSNFVRTFIGSIETEAH